MKATQKDVAGRLSSLLLVGLALLAAACTEDDEEAQPLPPPAAVYTCTATLAPFTVNYQLGDGGRMLVMAPGTATEDTLERLTAAGPRVQGTWLLADQPGVP
ncbi:MAG TPA: hypothetical protein PKU97_24995, partial [Kofleriaceae bacterium]|nr:hypothetical protein [Kofleriaceae bacterium]